MVAMKRKRPGDGYSEDEKLLHQATKALAKEARRVRTFMLQQAIRKSKSVGENAEAKKSKDAKKHGAMGAAGAGVVSATTTKDTSVDSAATSQEATGGGDEAKSREHAPGSDNDDDGGSGEDGGGGGGEDASDASDASGGGGEDASGDGGAGGGGAGKATLSSAAAAEDAPIPETPRDTAATRSAKEIATIKALQPEAAVRICLRRLGLRHTGPAGEEEVQVEGSTRLKELVLQIVEHKRVQIVVEELQLKVTDRRRTKLAETEGRSVPVQGQGRAGKGRGGKSKASTGERQGDKRRKKQDGVRAHATAGSTGSAFVSLSGEAPSDEEWASAPSARPTKRINNKNSNTGTGGQDHYQRIHEPGWAGADRAAGWGRGGGRAARGGRGGGRGGGRQSDIPGRGKQRENSSGRREGPGRGGASGGRGSVSRGVGSAAGSFSVGVGAGGKGEEAAAGDLHGSWAAKRALKEKEKSATKAFTGKRIQFGDDDD